MRRVSQQIGWSQESKLLYNVLKQFEKLTCVFCNNIPSTTTTTTSSTTTTSNPIIPFYVCPGAGCGSCPFSSEITIYVLQSCADNLTVGCSVWADDQGTVPYPDGVFHITGTASYTVVSGVIDSLIPC